MPHRFVILHHRQDQSEHWDLMLEHGDTLLTWQLLTDPTRPNPFPIAARRIGDHRKAYLAYEGPLSGDRGHVRRVDEGALDLRAVAVDSCDFSAFGVYLRGRFHLRRRGDDWELTPDMIPG